MRVRDAVRPDADAIAAAHIAAWRAGYRHIFPASIFDDPDFDRSRIEMWRRWSHSPTPDRRLFVADDGSRVVGFALSGHADEDGVDAGEVLGFYVHPDAWGSSAATLLMDAALEHLRSLGHDRVVVWTLADAHRARAFYSKAGVAPTGRTDTWRRYPEHPVEDLEYARDLEQVR